jgi:hypothetical protein
MLIDSYFRNTLLCRYKINKLLCSYQKYINNTGCGESVGEIILQFLLTKYIYAYFSCIYFPLLLHEICLAIVVNISITFAGKFLQFGQ